jgi:hypothetical protein
MTIKPLKIYIGYDPRDNNAYMVLKHTIRKNTKHPVEITPIWDIPLRHKALYWRTYRVDEKGQYWDGKDGRPFSTAFSFARFGVPLLEEFAYDWVLYMDADMMIRGDIKELFDLADDNYGVMCVKHKHQPEECLKMDGMVQRPYERKNWSSLMLMKPGKCQALTRYALNNYPGKVLHGMQWIDSELIGDLPKTWNFLAGHDDPSQCDPKNVHHTLGTPDMLSMNAVPTQWDDEWWANLQEAGGPW